jgi:hypothetical protein
MINIPEQKKLLEAGLQDAFNELQEMTTEKDISLLDIIAHANEQLLNNAVAMAELENKISSNKVTADIKIIAKGKLRSTHNKDVHLKNCLDWLMTQIEEVYKSKPSTE